MAVLISTTDEMPGYRIVAYKGLVWASTAQSRHIGSDIMAIGKSMMGGEIHQYKKLLNEGRNDVVQGVAKNAESIGANAVVGLRFGSTQIVPATIDMFAYGTAVVVKPEHGTHLPGSHSSSSHSGHASHPAKHAGHKRK